MKKTTVKKGVDKKRAAPATLESLKKVYAKVLKAAGFTYVEKDDRLIFPVKDDTFILMIDEKMPEKFSLLSGFTLEKIKYPIEIFEEMNLTMQTTPYVRIYSEAVAKGKFAVLFEFSQPCVKRQLPALLKTGLAAITRAMEMFGDMN